MTNAELVRLEAGDTGTATRDAADGDGSRREFYLSSPPIATGTDVVRVNLTPLTPVTDYSLDLVSGQLVLVAAPGVGEQNLVITYNSVQLSDAEVTEACTQAGVPPASTAVPGDLRILTAAAICCDWLAARYAQDFDVSADGQTLTRSQKAAAYERRGASLRDRLAKSRGLSSTPIRRIDGYEVNDYTERDVTETTDGGHSVYVRWNPDRVP